MTTPNLCELMKSGDKEAWIEGFDLLYPVALNAASFFKYKLNSDEAEDVAMIAINFVFDLKHKPKTIQDFKGLTSSISHRKAKDLLRSKLSIKRGKGKISSIDKFIDENPGYDFAAVEEDDLSDEDLCDLSIGLKKLLAYLKSEEQKVLEMFFVHGKSHQQISDCLSMPKGSVGVKIKRSLEKVKELMKEKPDLVKYLKVFLRCLPIAVLILCIQSRKFYYV